MLIAGRFVQGLGGAFASSVILAIIVTEFPAGPLQARAMGVFAFVAVSGGSIGLLAGGWLTQTLSWHWIFFINIPIGIFTLIAGRARIVESEAIGLGAGIDVLGSFMVTASTMLGVFGVIKATNDGWGSAVTLGSMAGAAVLFGLFLLYEGRISNPIMPLHILRNRGLIGSSVVRGLLVTGMFSVFFLGALYLGKVLGYGATRTGLAFLPQTLLVAGMSLGLTARLMARFGAIRMIVFGLSSVFVSLILLAQIGEHTAYFPTIFVALILMGIGMGSSFMPLLVVAMAGVPREESGLGSGIVNVSRAALRRARTCGADDAVDQPHQVAAGVRPLDGQRARRRLPAGLLHRRGLRRGRDGRRAGRAAQPARQAARDPGRAAARRDAGRPARARAGRGLDSPPRRIASAMPVWPAIAPIRIAPSPTWAPGRTIVSLSAAPSPMAAPSPITTGPSRRTPAPIRTSRPIHTGGSISSTPSKLLPVADPQSRARSPRPGRRASARRSSASNVPARSSSSEPTSFQYSSISWTWNGTSAASSAGNTSLAQSTGSPVGEVVEDLRLEHVDAAVAEVRQRLGRLGLLLEAGDAPAGVVQDDAVLARVLAPA